MPAGENAARVVIDAQRLLPGGAADFPAFVAAPARPGSTSAPASLNAWLKPRRRAVRPPWRGEPAAGRYDVKVTPEFISTLLPDTQKARRSSPYYRRRPPVGGRRATPVGWTSSRDAQRRPVDRRRAVRGLAAGPHGHPTSQSAA
ncbi:MAG: hypothetical protein U0797_18810 [Gemmataceae bacterium]